MAILTPVRDLREGDLVDLENDPYADPRGEDQMYPYELAEVVSVEQETDTCILVGLEGGACGFPPEHEVSVCGHVDVETGETSLWD